MLKISKVIRADDAQTRQDALAVLAATGRTEGGWVGQAESQLPESDLANPRVSWFVAYRGPAPAGVLRVYYEPPMAQHRTAQVTPLDHELDLERARRSNHVAAIGRFAIYPRDRRNLLIAVALMRAATREAMQRGYTHCVTDVFADEPQGPCGSYNQVMGFASLDIHEHGPAYNLDRTIEVLAAAGLGAPCKVWKWRA